MVELRQGEAGPPALLLNDQHVTNMGWSLRHVYRLIGHTESNTTALLDTAA